MQKSTKVLLTNDTYGFSVEDIRQDVGTDGITISTFSIDRGKIRGDKTLICFSNEEAIQIATTILDFCGIHHDLK